MYSFMKEELAQTITNELESEGAATEQEDKEALRQVVLESIEDYFDGKIADIWTTEDVRQRADESGIRFSEKEAKQVLSRVLEKFDAGIGICWDVLDVHIREIDGQTT